MKMDDPRLRAKRNSFINRSFRDTADRDYIAARLLYRQRLSEQFLWLALQAVEKYLKAILLYHDYSTKELSHNIVEALNKPRAIENLGFQVTKGAEEFIDYLNNQGPNRYFSYSHYLGSEALPQLDSVVWQIRRFCDDFFFPHDSEIMREHYHKRLKYIQGDDIHKDSMEFRLLQKGFLEEVLDTKKHPKLRETLIWKNSFYGSRNKGEVMLDGWELWSQPGNMMYPEIIDWARERVTLPKAVVEEMRKRAREKAAKNELVVNRR